MLVIQGKEIKMGTVGTNAGIYSGLTTMINTNAHKKQNLNIDYFQLQGDPTISSMNSINIIRDTDFIDATGHFEHTANEINSDDTNIIFP